MEIVINTIPLLVPLTGVGHYIHSLLIEFQRLRPDFTYTFYYGYGYFSKKLKMYKEGEVAGLYRLKEWVKKISVLSTQARKLEHRLPQINFKKYDIYFEPNFTPLDMRSKRIVTTVHDFSFHLHPEWHPRERIAYLSKNFFKRIEKADLIITGSRYIEREAHELLNDKDLRIVTIYYGYNHALFHAQKKAEEKKSNYILFVGSIEPRKNLLGLLKAYLLLPEYMKKEFQLLLIGYKGWGNQEIVEWMDQLKGRVNYLGYLGDEELATLYRGASCLVFPSFYEGFGLPPLEAMACGCPVVVSDVASLPEVCGDAAYYVNPYDVESMAEGMYKVLTDEDLRRSLTEKGLERAKLFSWEKCAKEHLEVFEEVLLRSP